MSDCILSFHSQSWLNLPSDLSTRKITRSSIRWVNTIIGVEVHIGVAAAQGFNHRSQINPPTPIVSIGSRYGPLDQSPLYRPATRSYGSKERDPNRAIFPSWGTVNVHCDEILDVKLGEREV